MIVGTAGHIDHGKTSLVKALTGVDCDRLKEEKARGITLDLGYAYVPLNDGEVLGFIDVPGHEKLVHNMLAGATGIDFVLLVIAADDGIMPQTREHLAILELLGLDAGVVALTKVDAVSPGRREQALAEVTAFLAATPFHGWPVLPVSSVTGEGVAGLRDRIHAAARTARRIRTGGHFRLAIDRVFTLPGAGVVVTGTAHAGRVAVGEHLRVCPGELTVRVKSLHAQNRPATLGHGGERLALNLAGVEKTDLGRGQWLVAGPVFHATQRFDARVRLLPDEPRALSTWTPVHCHLGAEDVLARIVPLQGDRLAPGEEALVQLVTDRPVHVMAGDRVVLRDAAATRTLGGGVVLDNAPPARHRKSPARLAQLAAAAAPEPLAARLALEPYGLDLKVFCRNHNLRADELSARLAPLAVKRIQGVDLDWAATASQWAALKGRVVDALARHHEREPDDLGPDRERLRRLSLPALPRGLFRAVLDGLIADGRVALTGSHLHLPEHRVQLAPAEEALWAKVRPLLAEQPFAPPRVRDIARTLLLEENRVRFLMKRVARTGEIVLVAHDHWFLAEAVQELAAILAELGGAEGVTAAAFRDRIGTGRKLAIHILEYFDRVGYTRRVGDRHRLRQPPDEPAAAAGQAQAGALSPAFAS